MINIDKAKIAHATQKSTQEDVSRFSENNPDGVRYLAICTAEVVRVNPEEMYAEVRIKNGAEPIRKTTLSFPYMGRRSFMGAMPCVGDIAIVGWTIENNEYKSPVILSWHPVGIIFGQDWHTTAPFKKTEFDLLSLEDQLRFKGAYNQIRHKLRSIAEGDILLSSEAGSDIILDEGVLITNRRANEIQLREADQTISFRALREQHTLAGTRVYGGIVQRDAHILGTQVVSDGRNWARYDLYDESRNLIEPPLVLSQNGVGTFEAHAIYDIDSEDDFYMPNHLNPYIFLEEAELIANKKVVKSSPYRVYGGKYFHTVKQQEENLTEYRVELSHTTNETLPVDESTEGFDSDKLLQKKNGVPPFVEFVLGTAIGNDPYNTNGSNLYGKPLMPIVSQKGVAKPTISTSNDINEHAAYLLKVNPIPNARSGVVRDPFFSAVTKNGRALLSVFGEGVGASRASAEAYFASGLDIYTGRNAKGESVNITTEGSLNFNLGTDGANKSMSFVADGGFRFESKGTATSAGRSSGEDSTLDTKDLDNGIELVSNSNFEISAESLLKIYAKDGVRITNTNSLSMSILSKVSLETENIQVQAKEMNQSISARATYTYSGPKNSNPTNFPLRETKFTSIVPNPKAKIDSTELLVGEKITRVKTTGAVRTKVNIGEIEHKVNVGQVVLSSGVNTKVTLSAVSLVAKSTFVSVSATGSLALSGTTSVSLRSDGLTAIHGNAITLSTNTTTFAGGILTSGTINPMTGAPFYASLCFGNPSTNVI